MPFVLVDVMVLDPLQHPAEAQVPLLSGTITPPVVPPFVVLTDAFVPGIIGVELVPATVIVPDTVIPLGVCPRVSVCC